MRKGMLLSTLLHGLAFVIAVVGLPESWDKLEVVDQPIPIEVVDISELTNAPKPKAVRDDTPEDAKQDKPEPEERKKPPPPEEPEPPRVATPVAPPQVEKQAKEKPEPKPEPEPEEKPVQKAQIKERPKRKPKPPEPEDFTSVLKTVEKIKRERRAPDPSPEEPTQTASARDARNIPDQPLTLSEIDAIRQQFKRCWNVDVGARNVDTMIVSIKIVLNSDRTVRDARILDRVDPSDHYYRSFAESALRAVRNPRCSPIRLPPKKFHLMRSFTLRFSPKDML